MHTSSWHYAIYSIKFRSPYIAYLHNVDDLSYFSSKVIQIKEKWHCKPQQTPIHDAEILDSGRILLVQSEYLK